MGSPPSKTSASLFRPVLSVRYSRKRGLFTFAVLFSDLAPEEMIRVVAAVERGSICASKGGRVERTSSVGLSKFSVFGEKPQNRPTGASYHHP